MVTAKSMNTDRRHPGGFYGQETRVDHVLIQVEFAQYLARSLWLDRTTIKVNTSRKSETQWQMHI